MLVRRVDAWGAPATPWMPGIAGLSDLWDTWSDLVTVGNDIHYDDISELTVKDPSQLTPSERARLQSVVDSDRRRLAGSSVRVFLLGAGVGVVVFGLVKAALRG